MAERQPLLGRDSGGSDRHDRERTDRDRSVPLRSLDPQKRLSLVEAAAAAVAADFRRRVPIRIRARLLRKAARIKRRFRPHEADQSEQEIEQIIARTPDLEALFQGEDTTSVSGPGHTARGSSNETSSLIASSLASSYGTLAPSHRKQDSTSECRSSTSSIAQSPSSSPSSGGGGHHSSTSVNLGLAGGGVELDDHSSRRELLLEELTNPVGKYRRIWLLVIFLFVLYNALLIPFLLAFQSLYHHFHLLYFLLILLYIGDIFFCLDVALYFYTPYTRDGMYERNLEEIRSHYLKTWFLPDLISSVPLDLLLIPFGIKAVLFARFTRFLRFWKYDSYFGIWEQYSTRTWLFIPQFIRFFKLMLGLMLILHWLACFWFYSAYSYGFGTTTWVPPYEAKHENVFTQYIIAIWWATNIITQVGGDPGLPTNNFERISDFFVAFIAVFVVAMVIGNVTELVSELSADEGELRLKLSILNNFMYTRRLPEELQKRIRNYYFTLWNRRGINDGDTAILSELPSNLRTEVSLIMNQDILGKVPIFQNSSTGFINSLVLHLKPQTYIPKEIIVKQGDSGSEMYFISRGQVNVVVNEKIVGRIGEGGFFGELAVISDNALRTASIVASQFVDTFVLTREDLQALFRVFPKERQVIMHVAETRRAKDLLRKTLADPSLLMREQLQGAFERHPVLVNLLIDLFQPLDLKALIERNCNNTPDSCRRQGHFSSGELSDFPAFKLDENGEIIGGYDLGDDDSYSVHDHTQDAGVIFTPDDDATTIYFIGKGAVDIYAHPELEETGSNAGMSRSTSYASTGPARKRDGHVADDSEERKDIVDADDTENDDDSDADSDATTEETGAQHVIRLTEGHFFGCISSEKYRVTAVVPEEFRVPGNDEAIIFALTSHDLPKLHDYYIHLPQVPSDASEGRDQLHLKKALVTWLQRHRTPLDYVKSMVSLQLSISPEGGRATRNWKAMLKQIAAAKLVSGRRPASATPGIGRRHSPVRRPPLSHAQTMAPTMSTDPTSEKKHVHKEFDEAHHTNKKPLITVSPAPEPSPNISVEPYANASWTAPSQPASATMTSSGTAAASTAVSAATVAASASSTSATATTAHSRPTPSGTFSSPSTSRPPLLRAASTGSVRPTDALDLSLSPLLHRARQTRGAGEASTQDVSELLAEADMHQNTRHAIRDGQQEPTQHSAPPTTMSPATGSPPPPANLEWLTGAAGHAGDPSRTRSVLSPTAPGGSPGRPPLSRIPSHPIHSGPRGSVSGMATQASLVSAASIGPSSTASHTMRHARGSLVGGVPISRHHREPAQPFSFLLSLPSTGGLPPITPTLLSSHSMISPSGSAGLMSPRIPSGGPSDSPNQKRGSGSTPSRRHSVAQGKSKQEYLERALGALSNEELLLIANKANLHLYARLQQAQHLQKQSDASAAAAQEQLANFTSPPSVITPAPRF